jgi:beta-glucosidase
MVLLLALIALAPPLYQRADAPVEDRIKDLLKRMTVEEKARQLDMYSGTEFIDKKLDDTHVAPDAHLREDVLKDRIGSLGMGSIHDIYPTPEIANAIQKWVIEHDRLGIPALFLEEGVHGYLGFGETVFPTSLAMAGAFDTQLAHDTSAAIAAEVRANGVHMILGPVLDVARDPRWGRIEEDFGEDPYLTGSLGGAYVKGMQGDSLATDHTVISEPKHFAGHGSPEGGLNTSPVHAGEREVRSIMLRSFEPAIREGHAMGVMAAYHEIDGVPCAGNSWLMTSVLRGEWGFRGFVLSDLGAINELWSRHHVAATREEAVRMAVTAGVDMQFYDFPHDVFQNALISKEMSREALDTAVSRVLRVKFELGLFDHPYVDPGLHPRVRRSEAHLNLSLKSAREAMCLLKNEGGLLPLKKDLPSIAVIGPNAASLRMGDYTAVQGVHAASMLDMIRQVSPKSQLLFDEGKDIDAAVAKAKQSSVVMLGLGERDGISGEGSDRSNLDLPDNQEALLEAVVATRKPVVLVLTNGRPLTISWAAAHVPAILEAWYPGEFGGLAIAETLFGDNNPAGRLPISFPRSVGAIPAYYNHDTSKDGKYVDGGMQALFPFGFGLSYTEFSYGNLQSLVKGTSATVSVDVTNTGTREGDDVVQLYLHADTSSVETPVRALKGFQRIHLAAGEKRTVTFRLTPYELEVWGAARKWSVEKGPRTIWVGGSSAASLRGKFVIGS